MTITDKYTSMRKMDTESTHKPIDLFHNCDQI